MDAGLLSIVAVVSSTSIFVVLLGGLVIVGIRATRRTRKLDQELDDEMPRVAEMVQRRHIKRNGKPDTKLNLIINESFSAGQRPR